MKPRNRVVATSVCFFMSLLTSHAIASTWNTFAEAYNVDSALFFFDADTVLKQGDTVTLWVKYVNTKQPDSDGSWATASRYVITCSKRTAQVMTTSLYDKDGKFIRSLNNPGQPRDIVPDSILEGVHKAVCTPDFPRNKSGDLYFPVKDNDIFQHTRSFVEYMESKKDQAPK